MSCDRIKPIFAGEEGFGLVITLNPRHDKVLVGKRFLRQFFKQPATAHLNEVSGSSRSPE
jgi:hypothetical protein